MDYRNFLAITNGCSLFDDPENGGEAQVYNWQEALGFTFGDDSEGYLNVAWIYQDEIVIDLRAYKNDLQNYLYVKSYIDNYKDVRPLSMNFELWLDRFIVSQGAKFWDWSINIYCKITTNLEDEFVNEQRNYRKDEQSFKCRKN